MESKRKRQIYFFLLFFLVSNFQINAAHIIGGEMTYRCLGNGDYEINLTIYRDCQGQGAWFDGANTGRISIYKGNSQEEFDNINMPDPTVVELDFSSNDPCLIFPPNLCVQEGNYVMKLSDYGINLPLSAESYTIVYQRCCRSNTITNIENPGETGVTYFTEIFGTAQSVCNNTPVFTNIPPIKVCVGEPLNYENAVLEVDGDSLVFELCSSLAGGGTAGWMTPGNINGFDGVNPDPDAPQPYNDVTYASLFSAMDPISSDPLISIDSETGVLTGTPNVIGEFVLGICVKEYRNGELISEITRDIHFHAMPCSDPLVVDYTHTGLASEFQFDNLSVNAHSYEWDFGDGNNSTIENPTHTFSQSGNYIVILKGYNQNCELTELMSKEIAVMTTDVELVKNDFKIDVFPNPNNGEFILKSNSQTNQTIEVDIVNMNGENLMTDKFEINQGVSSKRMELSHLPKGIYCLMIKSVNEVKIERLLIQ